MTIKELVAEYQTWVDNQGLPQLSANELLCEDLTEAQRAYVFAFIHRWHKAVNQDDNAAIS